MSQISLAQVKKNLSGTWAKESDLSETYVFAFTSDTQWSCTRKNGQGERKFRLAYDKAGEKLWWGESYFLDPVELNTKPAKAQWYRASDRAQKKAAFLWRKTAEATAAELRAIEALARVPSKVVAKGTGKSDVAKGAKGVGKSDVAAAPKWVPAPRAAGAVGPAAGERAEVGKSTRGRGAGSTWPLPEVVVDLEQMLVIYKPPYWKCELPAADTLDDPPQADRKRDNPFLLRWVKEAVKDIDAELYKEDFNPAISGTGFGPLSHRIDQETSGLLLVAKTKGAQRHLKAQFHKTEVSKRYICLVRGKVAKAKGVIDARIRTIRTDAMSRSEVSSSGEWAETTYQVVATYHSSGVEHHNAYSLLACDITTGRTHQIRVHMAHIGHPLVADDKYLSEAQLQEDRASVCPRLFLHSYRLCFCDINGKHMQVLCPIPDDLRLALANLGASDPSGPSSDSLFGENSWQRELVRPEVLQWRPGTRLLRRVASLVQDAAGPVTLRELKADSEVKRLMSEENLADLGRSWLSRHWSVFDTVLAPGDDELAVRLRPAHAGGDGSVEHSAERRIEAVRSELEDLQRQKQRAVAEEEYGQAAEVKRRVEAASAELASLLRLTEDPTCPDAGDSGWADGPAPENGQGRPGRRPKPKAEVFAQDVQDEELFPSLGAPPGRLAPKKAAAGGAGVPVGAGTAAPAAGAAAGGAAGAPGGSPDGGSAAGGAAEAMDLEAALVDFLKRHDDGIAHINEVNNNKFIRQVMAAQRPKPMQALNKAWLKEHESAFALLRTSENEMYVGLKKVVEKAAGKNGARGGTADQPRLPAYQNVIQKAAPGEAKPFTYQYSAAARSSSEVEAGNGQLGEWHAKFLAVLRDRPQRSCPAAELLASVPAFADAMGVRKPREQQELLKMFLEGSPKAFRVETRDSGSERQYIIWAK